MNDEWVTYSLNVVLRVHGHTVLKTGVLYCSTAAKVSSIKGQYLERAHPPMNLDKASHEAVVREMEVSESVATIVTGLWRTGYGAARVARYRYIGKASAV
ncbi:unnamed protein product [Ectocarpus sp. 12 AP-2014]